MWSEEQRRRYGRLREYELHRALTREEQAELAALIQQLCDLEAAYLTAANDRTAQEIEVAEEAVQHLEKQNRELQEYLRERQAFLARAKSLVADIQAENRRMRERFADLMPSVGGPAPHDST
jgi:hypothetical protein